MLHVENEYILRDGCGCVVATSTTSRFIQPAQTASAVGQPREKIRIEPIETPVPSKEPAPAVETPAEVPEKVPA